MSDEEALQALKQLLAPRVAEAQAGNLVKASANDVKRQARKRLKR